MLDGTAESSPASGETSVEAPEPEIQDAEIEGTEKEAEKTSEGTPASEQGSESQDETVTSSEDGVESEQKADQSVITDEMLGKAAQKRIKKLNAKFRAEEQARKDLEQRLNNPEPEKVDLKEPEAPKVDSFETWDAYQKAQDDYLKERDAWVTEKATREKDETDRKTRMDDERKKLLAEVEKREVKTVERNPEYDRIEARKTVRPSDTMDSFFVDSEIGPDVLWELYENPDEADRIRDLPGWKQARELIKMETSLNARIKGVKKPKESPPTYVDDHGSSPRDEKPVWEKLYQ